MKEELIDDLLNGMINRANELKNIGVNIDEALNQAMVEALNDDIANQTLICVYYDKSISDAIKALIDDLLFKFYDIRWKGGIK